MKKEITTKTMPFGKHKGVALDDVPADYLDWLQGQDWVQEKFPDIWEYILKNQKAIKQELKELDELSEQAHYYDAEDYGDRS